jgi:hypothetical protein
MELKKTNFTHERTISVFATSQMSKGKVNETGSFTTLGVKSNMFTERQKTATSLYSQNKYGLKIKNHKSLQPTARVTLAQKYNLPPI